MRSIKHTYFSENEESVHSSRRSLVVSMSYISAMKRERACETPDDAVQNGILRVLLTGRMLMMAIVCISKKNSTTNMEEYESSTV